MVYSPALAADQTRNRGGGGGQGYALGTSDSSICSRLAHDRPCLVGGGGVKGGTVCHSDPHPHTPRLHVRQSQHRRREKCSKAGTKGGKEGERGRYAAVTCGARLAHTTDVNGWC